MQQITCFKKKRNLPLPGKKIVIFKHFNKMTFYSIDFYRESQACFRKGQWFNWSTHQFLLLVAKLFVAEKMMSFRAAHLLQENTILSLTHFCFSFMWKALFEVNIIHQPNCHYPHYLMSSLLFWIRRYRLKFFFF